MGYISVTCPHCGELVVFEFDDRQYATCYDTEAIDLASSLGIELGIAEGGEIDE